MTSDGNGPRVLLVEDHAIIKQALALALQRAGMVVETAADLAPDAVLAVAAGFRPDIVLLDLYLGEADSLPLIRPLRELGAGVVVLTGTTDPRALGECLEHGALGVIAKSESLDRLAQAISDAAAGTAVMRPADRDELLAAARTGRAAEEERRAPFARLSAKERQILGHLMWGRSAEDIARMEYVSLATVRSQIRSILQKLEVNSQLGAVAMAQRLGWDPGS